MGDSLPQRTAVIKRLQTVHMPKQRADRDRSPFGLRMYLARKHRGLTQPDVRRLLGVSQGTISGLEGSGESSSQVVEYAQLYGVDPAWLSNETGPAPDWWEQASAGESIPPKVAPPQGGTQAGGAVTKAQPIAVFRVPQQ